MRAVLALSLLLSLCAPAAAKLHHHKAGHLDLRASHAMVPRFVRPRQPIDPNFPPVLEDQTPSYDDPSKFGGG